MKVGLLGLLSVASAAVAAPALAQTEAAPAPAETAPAAPAAEPAAAPPPAEAASDSAPADAPADERTANNALYLELLGAGLFYSVNYDRRIGDLALRGGLMYFSVSASNGSGDSASTTWLGVPLSVSYVGIGSAKHSFEVGAGITIHHFGGSVNTLGVESSDSATKVLGHAILGYRYQPVSTGFFLRAGLSPIVGSGVFLPWPHVGLGATF